MSLAQRSMIRAIMFTCVLVSTTANTAAATPPENTAPTAWEWQENWEDVELRGAPGSPVIVTGQLRPSHGPQRIRLPNLITTCQHR